jgi:plastocyanin
MPGWWRLVWSWEKKMIAFRTRLLAWGTTCCAVLALIALTTIGTLVWAAVSPPRIQVSQRGRDFQPKQIIVQRGETVQIVNDDADLLHHAYISSEKFNYDSGDMEPGSKADVTFTVAGDFNVLCGIHPKMKLSVRVN